MSTHQERKRYVNPFEPRDVHAALGQLLALVKDSDQLTPEIRLWLTHGLRAARERPGVGLDEALGLRPSRGQRWFHEARKRELVRLVGAQFNGSTTSRAEHIAAVLRGEIKPADREAREALEQLRRFAPLPGSGRQVRRLLRT